jgi:hypothetical protein
MAKVTNPLFSETAHGNVAKGSLQYRSGNWGTHAYQPLAPGKQNQQAPSPAQAKQRQRFNAICASWHALSKAVQDDYKQQAAEIGGLNGWNLYLSLGLAKSVYPADTLLTLDGLPLLNEYGQIIQID